MRDYSEIEENAYYELRSKPDDLLSVGDLMTVSGALFPICPSVHPMIWVYGQHTRTPILSPTNISTHPPISILSYVHLPDPNLTIRHPPSLCMKTFCGRINRVSLLFWLRLLIIWCTDIIQYISIFICYKYLSKKFCVLSWKCRLKIS